MITNYICTKCYKSFDRKSNYIRHLNRKKTCIDEKNIKNLKTQDKTKLKNYISKNFPKLGEDLIGEIIGENIPNVNVKKYECDYCNKSFQSLIYLKKHVSQLCSRNLRFEQHMIQERLKRIEKLKLDNIEMKEKIYYIAKTLPRYCVEDGKIINIEKNYIDFYDQKNINPFGDEYLDHVTDKFMRKMIMNPDIGLANLIRIIHFNNDIPQNRNLFVKTRNFTKVEVFTKEGWKTQQRRDVFHNIIVSKRNIMDDYFEKFREKNELKLKYIRKYEDFTSNLDDYISHIVFTTEYDKTIKQSRTVYEKICKQINLIFLNNLRIEVTYTPEQNINATFEEVKNMVKIKKTPPQVDDEVIETELYCEQNLNDSGINSGEMINQLIDETEKEVLKIVNENKDKSFEFLDEFGLYNPVEEDMIVTKIK